ncbi:hypothetical protein AB0M45_14900 [Nocardia sp. NPDC051787]|uniref:hypothetical protein n=1 Tax=Nocardia sp. NPDC051787 TaxID=3155415 RepID=UPI00341A7C53
MKALVRYTPHADDESWSADWAPSLFFDEHGESRDWDDLGEDEFIFSRFYVDVTLEIGGVDFSRHYLPVLDFALAWAAAPKALRTQDRVEVMMSVEALTYRLERDGDLVRVRSNVHAGQALISATALADSVDRMVDGAFSMLHRHHPELRHNPYLLVLLKRLLYPDVQYLNAWEWDVCRRCYRES